MAHVLKGSHRLHTIYVNVRTSEQYQIFPTADFSPSNVLISQTIDHHMACWFFVLFHDALLF